MEEYKKLLDGIEAEEGYRELFQRLDGCDKDEFLAAIKWRYEHKPLVLPGSDYKDNYPNRFLFDYGHLLTRCQLSALLADKDIRTSFYQDFLTHGFTLKLSKWSEELIDTFYGAYQSDSECDALEAKLLSYTAKNNCEWFNKNLDKVLKVPVVESSTNLWFEIFNQLDTEQKTAVFEQLLSSCGQERLNTAHPAVIKAWLSSAPIREHLEGVLNNDKAFESLRGSEANKTDNRFDFVAVVLHKRFETETTNAIFSQDRVQQLIHGQHVLKAQLARDSQYSIPPKLEESTRSILLRDDNVKACFNHHIKKTFDRYLIREIFDDKYNRLGKGFFCHKTPRHINQLRQELGGSANIELPLSDDVRDNLVRISRCAGNRSHWWYNSRHKDVQKLYELIRDNTTCENKDERLVESGQMFIV